MNLEKLYKMQEELDNHILKKNNIEMSKEELLDNTLLALLVEVGELANTTRCFKHWSDKGRMENEVILDELADVIHFYLSIGNQLTIRLGRWMNEKEARGIAKNNSMTIIFKMLYRGISCLEIDENRYDMGLIGYRLIGVWIKVLWDKLGFTDKQVEQAYLKKHEVNYQRQEEGY